MQGHITAAFLDVAVSLTIFLIFKRGDGFRSILIIRDTLVYVDGLVVAVEESRQISVGVVSMFVRTI